MRYYYTPLRVFIGRCGLTFALAMSLSTHAFSQDNSQQEIQQLLAQRETRIAEAQSTTDLDQQLFNLGYRPKAAVTVTGNSIQFPLFLPVSANKQAVMQDRLRTAYPFLLSIQLDATAEHIVATVNDTPTPEMITDIITHFGFDGYEQH